MQLIKIETDNLYSFKNLSLDFTKYEKGTTIILGKNLNMDSSNGAGKSSILKSIFFALWGSDINKVPLEGIVHDTNPDAGCLSKITFKDDRNTYVITRFKNYKNPDSLFLLKDGTIPKGSAVELVINNEVFYAPKDNNKIEKMVLGILGMSPEIFLNSVLTGQKRTENFLSSPDSMKKEILSEILDLVMYDNAMKHLEKDIKEKKELLNNKEVKFDELSKYMENISKDIKDFKTQAVEHNENIKTKAESINAEIIVQKNKINDINQSSKGKEDTTALIQNLNSIIELIKKNEALLNESNAVREKLSKLNLLLERNSSNSENNENKISNLNNKKNELINIISEKDNRTEEYRLNELKLNELDIFINELNELTVSLHDLEKNLNEIKIISTKNESVLNESSEKKNTTLLHLKKSKDENKCYTCERDFLEKNPLIVGLESDLEKINNKLNDLLLEKNNFSAKSEELSLKIIKIEGQIKNLSVKNKEKEDFVIKKIHISNSLNKIQESEKELNQLFLELKTLEESQLTIKETLVKLNNEINKTNSILLELNKLEEVNKEYVLKKENAQQEIHQIEKRNLEFLATESTILSIEQSIEKLNTALSDLKSGKNPYQDLLIKKSNELKIHVSTQEELKRDISTLSNKFQLLKFWEQGFSKNGIKSFIIDEIINLLNYKVKEYLNILSGGNVSLYFEPEKLIKKHGTTKNEITTKIYIDGKLKHPNSPSGGEEDRLTLAVDLALSDIAESRSGTKFNIKFLDEPFKWVDNKGQMKALALFNELSLNRQGFFLISHDEKMQSFCNNAIYVIKENGVSRIVEKEEFLNIKSEKK